MIPILKIATKLAIIAVTFSVAGFPALRVWHAEINLRQLLSPDRAVDHDVRDAADAIPARNQYALYQNGKLVARVHGAKVDLETSTVRFAFVDKSLALDVTKEFEFQQWRLRYRDSQAISEVRILGEADRAYNSMTCDIVGVRGEM